MGYNKNQFTKVNDKKVLHKVRKQWVTVSVAMLGLLGLGAFSYSTVINAAADENQQPKTTFEGRMTHNLNKERLQGNKQAAKNAKQQARSLASDPHQIENQAKLLHTHIMRLGDMSSAKRLTKSSNGRITNRYNRKANLKHNNKNNYKSIKRISLNEGPKFGSSRGKFSMTVYFKDPNNPKNFISKTWTAKPGTPITAPNGKVYKFGGTIDNPQIYAYSDHDKYPLNKYFQKNNENGADKHNVPSVPKSNLSPQAFYIQPKVMYNSDDQGHNPDKPHNGKAIKADPILVFGYVGEPVKIPFSDIETKYGKVQNTTNYKCESDNSHLSDSASNIIDEANNSYYSWRNKPYLKVSDGHGNQITDSKILLNGKRTSDLKNHRNFLIVRLKRNVPNNKRDQSNPNNFSWVSTPTINLDCRYAYVRIKFQEETPNNQGELVSDQNSYTCPEVDGRADTTIPYNSYFKQFVPNYKHYKLIPDQNSHSNQFPESYSTYTSRDPYEYKIHYVPLSDAGDSKLPFIIAPEGENKKQIASDLKHKRSWVSKQSDTALGLKKHPDYPLATFNQDGQINSDIYFNGQQFSDQVNSFVSDQSKRDNAHGNNQDTLVSDLHNDMSNKLFFKVSNSGTNMIWDLHNVVSTNQYSDQYNADGKEIPIIRYVRHVQESGPLSVYVAPDGDQDLSANNSYNQTHVELLKNAFQVKGFTNSDNLSVNSDNTNYKDVKSKIESFVNRKKADNESDYISPDDNPYNLDYGMNSNSVPYWDNSQNEPNSKFQYSGMYNGIPVVRYTSNVHEKKALPFIIAPDGMSDNTIKNNVSDNKDGKKSSGNVSQLYRPSFSANKGDISDYAYTNKQYSNDISTWIKNYTNNHPNSDRTVNGIKITNKNTYYIESDTKDAPTYKDNNGFNWNYHSDNSNKYNNWVNIKGTWTPVIRYQKQVHESTELPIIIAPASDNDPIDHANSNNNKKYSDVVKSGINKYHINVSDTFTGFYNSDTDQKTHNIITQYQSDPTSYSNNWHTNNASDISDKISNFVGQVQSDHNKRSFSDNNEKSETDTIESPYYYRYYNANDKSDQTKGDLAFQIKKGMPSWTAWTSNNNNSEPLTQSDCYKYPTIDKDKNGLTYAVVRYTRTIDDRGPLHFIIAPQSSDGTDNNTNSSINPNLLKKLTNKNPLSDASDFSRLQKDSHNNLFGEFTFNSDLDRELEANPQYSPQNAKNSGNYFSDIINKFEGYLDDKYGNDTVSTPLGPVTVHKRFHIHTDVEDNVEDNLYPYTYKNKISYAPKWVSDSFKNINNGRDHVKDPESKNNDYIPVIRYSVSERVTGPLKFIIASDNESNSNIINDLKNPNDKRSDTNKTINNGSDQVVKKNNTWRAIINPNPGNENIYDAHPDAEYDINGFSGFVNDQGQMVSDNASLESKSDYGSNSNLGHSVSDYSANNNVSFSNVIKRFYDTYLQPQTISSKSYYTNSDNGTHAHKITLIRKYTLDSDVKNALKYILQGANSNYAPAWANGDKKTKDSLNAINKDIDWITVKAGDGTANTIRIPIIRYHTNVYVNVQGKLPVEIGSDGTVYNRDQPYSDDNTNHQKDYGPHYIKYNFTISKYNKSSDENEDDTRNPSTNYRDLVGNKGLVPKYRTGYDSHSSDPDYHYYHSSDYSDYNYNDLDSDAVDPDLNNRKVVWDVRGENNSANSANSHNDYDEDGNKNDPFYNEADLEKFVIRWDTTSNDINWIQGKPNRSNTNPSDWDNNKDSVPNWKKNVKFQQPIYRYHARFQDYFPIILQDQNGNKTYTFIKGPRAMMGPINKHDTQVKGYSDNSSDLQNYYENSNIPSSDLVFNTNDVYDFDRRPIGIRNIFSEDNLLNNILTNSIYTKGAKLPNNSDFIYPTGPNGQPANDDDSKYRLDSARYDYDQYFNPNNSDNTPFINDAKSNMILDKTNNENYHIGEWGKPSNYKSIDINPNYVSASDWNKDKDNTVQVPNSKIPVLYYYRQYHQNIKMPDVMVGSDYQQTNNRTKDGGYHRVNNNDISADFVPIRYTKGGNNHVIRYAINADEDNDNSLSNETFNSGKNVFNNRIDLTNYLNSYKDYDWDNSDKVNANKPKLSVAFDYNKFFNNSNKPSDWLNKPSDWSAEWDSNIDQSDGSDQSHNKWNTPNWYFDSKDKLPIVRYIPKVSERFRVWVGSDNQTGDYQPVDLIIKGNARSHGTINLREAVNDYISAGRNDYDYYSDLDDADHFSDNGNGALNHITGSDFNPTASFKDVPSNSNDYYDYSNEPDDEYQINLSSDRPNDRERNSDGYDILNNNDIKDKGYQPEHLTKPSTNKSKDNSYNTPYYDKDPKEEAQGAAPILRYHHNITVSLPIILAPDPTYYKKINGSNVPMYKQINVPTQIKNGKVVSTTPEDIPDSDAVKNPSAISQLRYINFTLSDKNPSINKPIQDPSSHSLTQNGNYHDNLGFSDLSDITNLKIVKPNGQVVYNDNSDHGNLNHLLNGSDANKEIDINSIKDDLKAYSAKASAPYGLPSQPSRGQGWWSPAMDSKGQPIDRENIVLSDQSDQNPINYPMNNWLSASRLGTELNRKINNHNPKVNNGKPYNFYNLINYWIPIVRYTTRQKAPQIYQNQYYWVPKYNANQSVLKKYITNKTYHNAIVTILNDRANKNDAGPKNDNDPANVTFDNGNDLSNDTVTKLESEGFNNNDINNLINDSNNFFNYLTVTHDSMHGGTPDGMWNNGRSIGFKTPKNKVGTPPYLYKKGNGQGANSNAYFQNYGATSSISDSDAIPGDLIPLHGNIFNSNDIDYAEVTWNGAPRLVKKLSSSNLDNIKHTFVINHDNVLSDNPVINGVKTNGATYLDASSSDSDANISTNITQKDEFYPKGVNPLKVQVYDTNDQANVQYLCPFINGRYYAPKIENNGRFADYKQLQPINYSTNAVAVDHQSDGHYYLAPGNHILPLKDYDIKFLNSSGELDPSDLTESGPVKEKHIVAPIGSEFQLDPKYMVLYEIDPLGNKFPVAALNSNSDNPGPMGELNTDPSAFGLNSDWIPDAMNNSYYNTQGNGHQGANYLYSDNGTIKRLPQAINGSYYKWNTSSDFSFDPNNPKPTIGNEEYFDRLAHRLTWQSDYNKMEDMLKETGKSIPADLQQRLQWMSNLPLGPGYLDNENGKIFNPAENGEIPLYVSPNPTKAVRINVKYVNILDDHYLGDLPANIIPPKDVRKFNVMTYVPAREKNGTYIIEHKYAMHFRDPKYPNANFQYVMAGQNPSYYKGATSLTAYIFLSPYDPADPDSYDQPLSLNVNYVNADTGNPISDPSNSKNNIDSDNNIIDVNKTNTINHNPFVLYNINAPYVPGQPYMVDANGDRHEVVLTHQSNSNGTPMTGYTDANGEPASSSQPGGYTFYPMKVAYKSSDKSDVGWSRTLPSLSDVLDNSVLTPSDATNNSTYSNNSYNGPLNFGKTHGISDLINLTKAKNEQWTPVREDYYKYNYGGNNNTNHGQIKGTPLYSDNTLPTQANGGFNDIDFSDIPLASDASKSHYYDATGKGIHGDELPKNGEILSYNNNGSAFIRHLIVIALRKNQDLNQGQIQFMDDDHFSDEYTTNDKGVKKDHLPIHQISGQGINTIPMNNGVPSNLNSTLNSDIDRMDNDGLRLSKIYDNDALNNESYDTVSDFMRNVNPTHHYTVVMTHYQKPTVYPNLNINQHVLARFVYKDASGNEHDVNPSDLPPAYKHLQPLQNNWYRDPNGDLNTGAKLYPAQWFNGGHSNDYYDVPKVLSDQYHTGSLNDASNNNHQVWLDKPTSDVQYIPRNNYISNYSNDQIPPFTTSDNTQIDGITYYNWLLGNPLDNVLSPFSVNYENSDAYSYFTRGQYNIDTDYANTDNHMIMLPPNASDNYIKETNGSLIKRPDGSLVYNPLFVGNDKNKNINNVSDGRKYYSDLNNDVKELNNATYLSPSTVLNMYDPILKDPNNPSKPLPHSDQPGLTKNMYQVITYTLPPEIAQPKNRIQFVYAKNGYTHNIGNAFSVVKSSDGKAADIYNYGYHASIPLQGNEFDLTNDKKSHFYSDAVKMLGPELYNNYHYIEAKYNGDVTSNDVMNDDGTYYIYVTSPDIMVHYRWDNTSDGHQSGHKGNDADTSEINYDPSLDIKLSDHQPFEISDPNGNLILNSDGTYKTGTPFNNILSSYTNPSDINRDLGLKGKDKVKVSGYYSVPSWSYDPQNVYIYLENPDHKPAKPKPKKPSDKPTPPSPSPSPVPLIPTPPTPKPTPWPHVPTPNPTPQPYRPKKPRKNNSRPRRNHAKIIYRDKKSHKLIKRIPIHGPNGKRINYHHFDNLIPRHKLPQTNEPHVHESMWGAILAAVAFVIASLGRLADDVKHRR